MRDFRFPGVQGSAQEGRGPSVHGTSRPIVHALSQALFFFRASRPSALLSACRLSRRDFSSSDRWLSVAFCNNARGMDFAVELYLIDEGSRGKYYASCSGKINAYGNDRGTAASA